MDLSPITIKQLFKAVPLSCGVAGVVSGGYGCNELSKLAHFSNILKEAEYQDGSNNHDRTKILLKNDGCYKRYFSKDVQENDLDISKSLDDGLNTPISNISNPKKGCAIIIHFKNSNQYLSEIALMNDNDAELFYVVANSNSVNLIKRKFSKNNNKWTISKESKDFWTVSPGQIGFYFSLNNEEISLEKNETEENKIYDLMSTNNDIKIEVSVEYSKIELKGSWEERYKH